MSSASRRSFVGPAAIAVLLFSSGVLGQTTRTPTIWQVRYSPDGAAGPDGPWNVLNQTIDFPDQFVLMYPSLAQASLIIPTTACQPSNASCPEPLPGLWAGSAAQNTAKSMDGPPFDAATWDPISEPLGLRGQGHYIAQRITLKPLQSNGDTAFLDNQAVAVGESFAQSYPGGARYTSTVGFFSLFGGSTNITYNNRTGSPVSLNRTLGAAFVQNWAPSMSYGLHIGSSKYKIPGTLYVGAFDNARVLSNPIQAAADNRFPLKRLAFNVASGGSAYSNVQNTPSGLAATVQNLDLSVRLEPGVPYLYLPQAVCDGLARFLPVTYNREYNLYLWNTNQDAYKAIISSPHYLSFTFTDSSATASPTANNTSINVPLALLSLNLSAPISTTVTPYFPCRPYTPADGRTYILGRAFLQAAFMAQHWQARRLWLAQAPGPYIPPGNIVNFDRSDGSVTAPTGNQITWDNTWSTALKALDASLDNSGSNNGTNPDGEGMSSGAKAGVAIGVSLGVLALIGGLAFFLVKRRRAQRQQQQQVLDDPGKPPAVYAKVQPTEEYVPSQHDQKFTYPAPPGELASESRHEMDGGVAPVPARTTAPNIVAELPGEDFPPHASESGPRILK